jgi:hypothetical protein
MRNLASAAANQVPQGASFGTYLLLSPLNHTGAAVSTPVGFAAPAVD